MAAAPLDEASRVTLEAWLVTDVGVVREHNEDSAYMEPSNGFFIVADGMGGHAAGEVASAMAVDTVRKTLESSRKEIDTFKKAPTDAGRRSIVQLLQSAVLSAHQAVFQRGQNEADKAGMGTTLDVVLIAGPEAFVAHVGDSRTYLVRDGRSSQITTDHTVAEVLVIEGKLTIEEAQVSPLRTILVNAIGVSADVGVEMAHVTLKRGDRLLLCSDGLHDYFPLEEEIAQKLSAEAPGDALKDMVELAKTRGGHDNITGVAVQVTDVFEAIPSHIDGDVTHPGDLPTSNPFAVDEPTETAMFDSTGMLPKVISTTSVPSDLKATQPMRVVDDPDDEPPRLEPAPAVNTVPATPDGEAKSDTGFELEPTVRVDTKADAKPDAKPDTKPDADPHAASEGKPDAEAKASAGTGSEATASAGDKPAPTSDAKPAANHESVPEATNQPDTAPAEISIADTGRMPTPNDQDPSRSGG